MAGIGNEVPHALLRVSEVFDFFTYCPSLIWQSVLFLLNIDVCTLISYILKTHNYKIDWIIKKALLTLQCMGLWAWSVQLMGLTWNSQRIFEDHSEPWVAEIIINCYCTAAWQSNTLNIIIWCRWCPKHLVKCHFAFFRFWWWFLHNPKCLGGDSLY